MIQLKLKDYDNAYKMVERIVMEQVEKIYGDYMPGTIIVDLAIKSPFESEYYRSNEILFIAVGEENMWENDWHEGETDIIIYGITDVKEVECKHACTEKQYS